MLSKHQDAILEAWKSPLSGATKDRVVLVEQMGDHVTVAAASAKQVIHLHKYLGWHLVDEIQTPRRPDEPFVVVIDWDGADGGPVEVHKGELRFRSFVSGG